MRTKSLERRAELLYVGDTLAQIFEAADTAGVQCLTAAWDPNQPIVEAGDQIVFTFGRAVVGLLATATWLKQLNKQDN